MLELRHETSAKAMRPCMGDSKWLSAYDLDKLTAGASRYFDRIGSGTIQRINAEFATRRAQFKRKRLRWRVSFGAKRSLGWVPLKAEQLKRRGKCLRFSGKAFRMFEQARLADVKWKSGCFAQDAVGDWWLCLPVEQVIEQSIAPFGRWALIWGSRIPLPAVTVTNYGPGASIEASSIRSPRPSVGATSARPSDCTGRPRIGAAMHSTSSPGVLSIAIRASSLAM